MCRSKYNSCATVKSLYQQEAKILATTLLAQQHSLEAVGRLFDNFVSSNRPDPED
jgi:hypothetical protein